MNKLNTDSLCYLGPSNKKLLLEYGKKNLFLEKELEVEEYDNAFIYPTRSFQEGGGIETTEGKYIDASALCEYFRKGVYKEDGEEVIYRDEEVIFIGELFDVFGHAITDNLKKFWFLKTTKYKELSKKGIRIVYNVYGGKDLAPYALRIIELAGFDLSLAEKITKPTQFKRVLMPQNSIIWKDNTILYTNAFKTIINDIKANVLKKIDPSWSIFDKIYLSRLQFIRHKDNAFQRKRDYGEERLEEAFKKAGYRVLYPETMSIEQQIYTAMMSKKLVATMGSVVHISIFCNTTTEIIILLKANYYNFHQGMIEQLTKCKTTYIDVHHTLPKEEFLGPFYMTRTKYLLKFLNQKGTDFRWFDKLWWKYFFRWLRKRRQQEVKAILKKISPQK